MTAQDEAARDPSIDLSLSLTQHLVHRTASEDSPLVDLLADGEQLFSLAGPIPQAHPLFNDGIQQFHDVQLPVETTWRIALFAARRYFRVPRERPFLFYSLSFELTDPGAWRVRPHTSHMTMDISTKPIDMIKGVPRRLEFRGDVSIDGSPCGTGSALLVFLMPSVHGSHRSLSRERSLRAAHSAKPHELAEPIEAAAVGRDDPRNVVVSGPFQETENGFKVGVTVNPDHPIFFAEPLDYVSGMLILEAFRQTAYLTSSHIYNLAPSRCTLANYSVHFRDYAELDLPLECAAEPGPVQYDKGGHPTVPVKLTLLQSDQVVAEATANVIEDF